MAYLDRVIILIDMDCFYCQVEEKLDPELEGKPIAVVQYNEWRGGGIIAVNYNARNMGVTRHMRGKEAKQKCPEIVLVKVPQIRGKADLSKFRKAGKNVADVLQTFTNHLERASVDEAYLDITSLVLNRMKDGVDQISIHKLKNTYIVGCDTKDFLYNLTSQIELAESDFKLCLGGIIAEEIRAEVFKQTGYTCSAGIAHNKILAKLVCGLNKPNKQTILPHGSIEEFFKTLPLKKVRSLGGKFGQTLSEDLCISSMGELTKFSEKQLIEKFGKKSGSWLHNIARGIDYDPVVKKLISKSIGCCKRFPGRTALLTHDAIQHWINELAAEIAERLQEDFEENNRRAKQMIVSFGQKNVNGSRTNPLNSYEQLQIAQTALEVVKSSCQKSDGSYNVTFLGISVSNFQEDRKTKDIASFFRKNTVLVEKKYEKDEVLQAMDLEEDYIKDVISNEEIKDTENHSIYSASTEDLDEDPNSYIYFEDIYPEFVSSQPLESDQLGNKVGSSISDDKEDFEARRKASKSFFTKYFELMAINNKTPELQMQNELDDLKITESKTEMMVKNEEKRKSVKRKASEIDILHYFTRCEEPNENYCIECKKNIPIEELFDHADYHVAKRLQAEINKSEQTNILVNKDIIKVTPKNKKVGNSSISNYFKPM